LYHTVLFTVKYNIKQKNLKNFLPFTEPCIGKKRLSLQKGGRPFRESLRMTAEEFTVQIMDMKKTLYHVSCGILRSEADREDAVQECICKAWEKRDSLKSAGAFRAWVTRILINECYDICRRGSKIVLLDEMPEAVAPESGDRELRDAVMGLDEIYRMPILLFYVEGFSIREISRILQIPEGTVKSRLFAGRGKLREVLGEEVPV